MQNDHVWLWSEAFAETVDGLMRNPPPERAARPDWPRDRQQLRWWRRLVETARQRCRQGQEEPLRDLFDYWRAIAEDVQEQARIASETYRELGLRVKA